MKDKIHTLTKRESSRTILSEDREKVYTLVTEGKTPEEIAKHLIALSKERLLVEERLSKGDADDLRTIGAMATGIRDAMERLDDDILKQVMEAVNECRKEAERRIEEENGGKWIGSQASVARACGFIISEDISAKTKQGRLRERTLDEMMGDNKGGQFLTSYELMEKYGDQQESE